MNKPCPPKTDCWCETHPNHQDCVVILPIKNTAFAVFIVLMILVVLKNKFKK